MAQVFGLLQSHGRPGRCLWLLASATLISSCCGHMQNEPVHGRSCSLFSFLCKSVLPIKLNMSLEQIICMGCKVRVYIGGCGGTRYLTPFGLLPRWL